MQFLVFLFRNIGDQIPHVLYNFILLVFVVVAARNILRCALFCAQFTHSQL